MGAGLIPQGHPVVVRTQLMAFFNRVPLEKGKPGDKPSALLGPHGGPLGAQPHPS